MPFQTEITDRLHKTATEDPRSAARIAYLGLVHDAIQRHAGRLAVLLTNDAARLLTARQLQSRRVHISWAISYCTKARLNLPRSFKTERVEQAFFGRHGGLVRAYERGGWTRIQRMIRIAALEVSCTWIEWKAL